MEPIRLRTGDLFQSPPPAQGRPPRRRRRPQAAKHPFYLKHAPNEGAQAETHGRRPGPLVCGGSAAQSAAAAHGTGAERAPKRQRPHGYAPPPLHGRPPHEDGWRSGEAGRREGAACRDRGGQPKRAPSRHGRLAPHKRSRRRCHCGGADGHAPYARAGAPPAGGRRVSAGRRRRCHCGAAPAKPLSGVQPLFAPDTGAVRAERALTRDLHFLLILDI